MTTFQRVLPIGFLALALLSGCGTTATDAESAREIVLQYLGADAAVGTAGPFHRGSKDELRVLSAGDRQQASALLDRGADMFLVYAGNKVPADTDTNTTASNVTRVILVQHDKIAADFRAQPAGQ